MRSIRLLLLLLGLRLCRRSGQGEGLKLLRFSSGPLPSQIARGHPAVPKVDMEAKGWIFTPVRMPGAR